MRRAVFLDRDGVLNAIWLDAQGVPHPPQTAEACVVLPGVAEALAQLRELGFLLLVVTNQPDVARGTQTRAEVERIHATLAAELPIDGWYVCYHDSDDGCGCRKPRPGMLYAGAYDHQVALTHSFLVGDRWGDIVAGTTAGCITLLVDGAHSQRERCTANYLVADLAAAVDTIKRYLHQERQP